MGHKELGVHYLDLVVAFKVFFRFIRTLIYTRVQFLVNNKSQVDSFFVELMHVIYSPDTDGSCLKPHSRAWAIWKCPSPLLHPEMELHVGTHLGELVSLGW